MSSDTAAFFANKKKKKKSFKGFNANKIDVASVTPTVHVDAPAVSVEVEKPVAQQAETTAAADDAADSQWDDEALAKATSRTTTSNVDIMDMKALEIQMNNDQDIAEKLRVEETKAALQAAREGMEREAQRLKEEQEKKKEESTTPTTKTSGGSSRFGAAAANLAAAGGEGGKAWVPPHMRAGGAGTLSRVKLSQKQQLDTQDENLFPDLASADKILEQEKAKPAAYKVPKKTPVGGGATWGSRSAQMRKAAPPHAPPKEEKKVEPPVAAPAPAPVAPPPPAPAAAPKPAEPVKPSVGAGLKKKKKKKDLSTFKPSSS